MAWSSAYRTPPQNFPLSYKDKLAGIGSTKSNNNLAILYTPILTPIIVPATALSSVAQYLKNDLQQIFRTILKSRPLIFLALAPAFHHKSPVSGRLPG